MKISTEIGSASHRIGEEKAIEYYAKAGFDAFDFSLMAMCKYDWDTETPILRDHHLYGKDYLKYVRKLARIASDCGIECNQSHAPFPVFCPEIRDLLKRSIECTAEAGGKICIIHPDNHKSAQENAEMYFELLPFAKEHNVKIATENMWLWNDDKTGIISCACSTPEDFNAHLNAVDDDFFVACLDIGHAEISSLGTSAVEMIHALGNKLQALHIHDTDRQHDSHQIPFSMDIDFSAIVAALKETGYDGYFTLEADQYLKIYPDDNIFEGMKNLAVSARKLADMFENL